MTRLRSIMLAVVKFAAAIAGLLLYLACAAGPLIAFDPTATFARIALLAGGITIGTIVFHWYFNRVLRVYGWS